jgi:hypothetical protein
MNRIKARWEAKTPGFFKKIIKIGIGIGAISGTILLAPATGLELPALIITLSQYGLLAGSIAATISKMTKEDINVDVDKLSFDELIDLAKKLYIPEKMKFDIKNVTKEELENYVIEYQKMLKTL